MAIVRGQAQFGAKHLQILADRGPGIRVVQGGYGSGKTSLGCGWALDLGLRHGQDGPILGTEPTYPMVRDVMAASMIASLERWGVPYRHWVSDRKIAFGRVRKAELWMRSLDRPRAVEGINAIGLWADEWEICDVESLIPAMARVRVGKALEILLTGTPEGFGPGYDLVVAEPQATTRVYRLSMRDNPFLPSSYVEDSQHRLGDESMISEKIDGIRTARGGRVYSRFDRTRHVTATCPIVDGEIAIACDFNVGHMHWLICVVDKWRVHVVGERIGHHVTTDEQAENVGDWIAAYLTRSGRKATRDGVRAMRIEAYCDASGASRSAVTPQTHVSLLAQAGYRPRHGAANPRVADRVNTVQVLLRDGRITIDPSVKGLIQSLERQAYKDGEPDKSGDVDHCLDALGYLCHWRYPVEKRAPLSLPRPRPRPAVSDEWGPVA